MEKSKRGIVGWWGNLEWYDKGMVMLIGGLMLGVVIILGMLQQHHHMKQSATCAELGGWEADELPVRCYAYYGLKEPQD